MQALRDITSKIWPSTRAFAADIEEEYDTVRKWLLRGRIPERVWPKIIRRSARTANPITADKLLALNSKRDELQKAS